jgi:hypothetical protein
MKFRLEKVWKDSPIAQEADSQEELLGKVMIWQNRYWM